MSVSLDGTSNAPTKALMAPMFGMMTCCVNPLPTCALPRSTPLFASSCESRRQLLLPGDAETLIEQTLFQSGEQEQNVIALAAESHQAHAATFFL